MGTKVLTSIASLIGIETEEEMSEEEVEKALAKIVDPAGLFYMYSLPSSVLRRRRME